MAEAWLRYTCGDFFAPRSAGLEPGTINPLVIEAMAEVGIDLSLMGTRGVDDLLRTGAQFDYVVTVCSEADAEGCPVFPGSAERLHWPFPDPSKLTGTQEEKLREVRRLRDEIRVKVEEWCEKVCPPEALHLGAMEQ